MQEQNQVVPRTLKLPNAYPPLAVPQRLVEGLGNHMSRGAAVRFEGDGECIAEGIYELAVWVHRLHACGWRAVGAAVGDSVLLNKEGCYCMVRKGRKGGLTWGVISLDEWGAVPPLVSARTYSH